MPPTTALGPLHVPPASGVPPSCAKSEVDASEEHSVIVPSVPASGGVLIVTVTVAITIDGITREGLGTGYADSEMGIKKAEHDALKRAAVKFGIARELYKKESDTIEREGAVPPPHHGGDDVDRPGCHQPAHRCRTRAREPPAGAAAAG